MSIFSKFIRKLNGFQSTQDLLKAIGNMKAMDADKENIFLKEIRPLVKRADINAKTEQESTMLHQAIRTHNLGVVKLLLEHDARVDIADEYGNFPLHTACGVASKRIYTIAIEKVVALFQLLLEKGADPNALDGRKFPVLFTAVLYRFPAVVQLLLEKGANVNYQHSINLEAPLHKAISLGDKVIIQLLISKGADLNVKTKEGLGIIEYTRKDNPSVLKFIEEHVSNAKRFTP